MTVLDARTFELPIAVGLRLQSRSGNVRVIAEPRDDVLAEGDRISGGLTEDGHAVEIRAGRGSGSLTVRCPAGTDVTVGTHSGNVRLEGQFGDVSVTTMSGKIEVDMADQADLRAMSADVVVGSCSGRCRISTVSGKVVGGHADSAMASSMSGSITFEHVNGEFKARSVSGTVNASCDGDGSIAVKTVSGGVHISLPAGTAPMTLFKTMSGKVRCDLPAGSDVRIEAMSISGSIEVVAP